jgi:hypothetical protein
MILSSCLNSDSNPSGAAMPRAESRILLVAPLTSRLMKRANQSSTPWAPVVRRSVGLPRLGSSDGRGRGSHTAELAVFHWESFGGTTPLNLMTFWSFSTAVLARCLIAFSCGSSGGKWA